ncbi:cellulase family glycosylhydrolase [Flammeovirga aprica]|uniref:Cellulase family glycosylhydrolase n=1 Tax=Flammeovirga aprica JL-4 TaxID=694437 RepID=A0A7X9XAT1_9BACT|nr:cellulase family glycosylhydrolase [Flammeovirga aprica]NME70000.1 cellulase family glycosylhydrolase [Flammeovirga aprica JL-4]
MLRYFITITLSIIGLQSFAQGFLRTEGTKIVNDNGPVIIRSIGTGNWMIQEGYMMQSTDAKINTHTQFRTKLEENIGKEKTAEFYDVWLENHFTKTDLDSMKAWGFNAVRVALHYKWFTLPIEEEKVKNGKIKHTWLKEGFEYTDKLMEWCTENEMYLIFDMHGAPGGQGKDANISDYDESLPSLWDSEFNKEKLEQLWIKIAKRYKDEKWVGGYDLINEPNWKFKNTGSDNGCGCNNNDEIWDLHARLTKAIRTVDKNHIVYISGNCWGNNYESFEQHDLKNVDDNMVITFHKYWTFNTDASVQGWIDMREKYQMPLWMSEAGENSNTWFSDCISLFEKNNIGWSWWPVKKQRVNNVLKVKTPDSYYKLLDAWEKGKNLSANETFQAVMDYAESHKIENCEVANDVIYAMIGQINNDNTKPFKEHKTNQDILFADYDMGKNHFAYYDKISANYHIDMQAERTMWNTGFKYRNDGVDIELMDDTPIVFETEEGEWMKYTLKSDKKGQFQFNITYQNDSEEGKIRINNGAESLIVPLPIASKKWNTITTKAISLEKGKNEIVFYIIKGDLKLKSFNVTSK